MKHVFHLVILLTTLIFVVSCQKDDNNIVSTKDATQTSTDLTGEELEQQEFDQFQKDTSFASVFDEKIANLDLDGEFDIPEDDNLQRSRYYYPLHCGYYNWGTTIGETNTANFYSGPDRIYFFTLDRTREVEITLSDQTADHDLFLTEVDWRYGRMYRGTTITTSLNSGHDLELISITLDPGTYFIVVDAYRGSSRFKLDLQCFEPLFTNSCENYDEYTASYYRGISQQSHLWRKWSSWAGDGRVLLESYARLDNTVVKFDHSRFGYQDAVRSLTNYHIIGGAFAVEFDMYIPRGYDAELVSEKLSRHGREQGFHLNLHDGYIDVRHRALIARSRFNYPRDRWFKVKMDFDMNNNQINVRIDQHTLILMKATGKVNSYRDGIRSIWGLDFFANDRDDKFHIDNFCVKRYNSPWIPGIVGADEIIDLTR